MSDDLNSWFSSLSNTDKLIFIAYLMGYLTICGRDVAISLSGEQQVNAFTGLNELQHQISNYFTGIGKEHEVYPGDTILKILREKATHYGLSRQLQASLQYARDRNHWSDNA